MLLLITILLFGGGESAFVNDKVIKHAKAHIDDRARRTEIIELAKNHQKWAKSNSKAFVQTTKDLAKLNANREATIAEFSAFFNQARELKAERQSRQASARLAMAALTTADEWSAMLESLARDDSKRTKAIQKGEAKLHQAFKRFRGRVSGVIRDDNRRAAALEAIGNYKVALDDLTAALIHFNYRDAPILRDRQASAERLLLAANEINRRRAVAQAAFAQLHFDLLAATTNEEWSQVARAMNKL